MEIFDFKKTPFRYVFSVAIMCSCDTVCIAMGKGACIKGWLQSEITVRHYNGKKQTGGKG